MAPFYYRNGSAAAGTDVKVAVDSAATADYIGNTISTGVIQTPATGGIIKTDAGDYVTLTMNINALTADTPVLADSICFYDASGADTNKCTLTALNAILDHDALVNFVANEHIDWTNTSSNLVTTGDVTCDELIITSPSWDYKFTNFIGALILEGQGSGSGNILIMQAKDDDGTDDVLLYLVKDGFAVNNLIVGYDTSLGYFKIEAAGDDLYISGSSALDITATGIVSVSSSATVRIKNFPTSSAGLAAGTLWNNLGVASFA